MKDGIKFSSIFLILPEELMDLIMLKLSELPFMLIVELEEFISVIDFILKKNCLWNLNFMFLLLKLLKKFINLQNLKGKSKSIKLRKKPKKKMNNKKLIRLNKR